MDKSAKWREQVGGFILACGDIELISYRVWEDLFPNKAAENKFKLRLKKIIKGLQEQHPDKKDAAALIKRAVHLVDKRNIVAHNPLQLQVYQHRRTGALEFEHAISGRAAKDYIDDAELSELRAEAESIVSGFYIAYQLEFVVPTRG